jgi:hypothetical protein
MRTSAGVDEGRAPASSATSSRSASSQTTNRFYHRFEADLREHDRSLTIFTISLPVADGPVKLTAYAIVLDETARRPGP